MATTYGAGGESLEAARAAVNGADRTTNVAITVALAET
jgi:hypothetical protein